MNDTFDNPSADQYIAAIEGNLSAWVPALGNLGQTHLDHPAGVNRAANDIPSALFNSIMDTHLAPERVDETIQFIVSDAATRNVPVLWWIGPSTQPADLGKHLENFGFTLDEDSPGMAVNLTRLQGSTSNPAGLTIRLAQGDQAWLQWSKVMLAGFGAVSPEKYLVDAWVDLLRRSNPESVLPFTGYLNGKPVATSLLYLAAGAAGIYAVATIAEARRKGIGTWMTLHPLQKARGMGFKIGTLQSSEDGFGVYRSIGFQEYCRISSYCWTPPSE